MQITEVEVWAGEIRDQPGALAAALVATGGHAECVIGRRQPERPGTAVLFVTPVKGKKAQSAARDAGFSPVPNVATLRVQCPARPDATVAIARTLDQAGLNIRGFTSVVAAKTLVAYIGFDSEDDARRAIKALKGVAQ
jgi:hypothetical protein